METHFFLEKQEQCKILSMKNIFLLFLAWNEVEWNFFMKFDAKIVILAIPNADDLLDQQ